MEELKLIFIAQSLKKYAEEVVAEMQRRIITLNAVDTRRLLQSLSYRVFQNTAQGNMDLSFAEWGRFLDMGVTRGNPLGGITATTEALSGKPEKKVNPRKLYSPVAYGKLNWLMGELAYGFTEETIQSIKSQINNV